VRGSDLKVRHGHISKQGSAWLRWVMNQAAQTAKRSPQFAATYSNIAKRRGKKIANNPLPRPSMISRRLPASDPAAARKIQKNSQASPTAPLVTGLGPYALLTMVALMGAAVREESWFGLIWIVTQVRRLMHVQAFHGLTGDLGDEVEVLIEVQHRQPGEFSDRSDDQIRY
jgi:hypothetical protein